MSGRKRSRKTFAANSDHESSSSEDWTRGVDFSWSDPFLLSQDGNAPTSDPEKLMDNGDQTTGTTDPLMGSIDRLSPAQPPLEDSKKPAAAPLPTHQEQRTQRVDDPPLTKKETKRAAKRSLQQRNKHAKGTPKRPLTAYNLFFRDRREALMSGASPRLSFSMLGKVVGREWHDLDPKERKKYDRLARIETDRYHREMDEYHEKQRQQRDKELTAGRSEAIMPSTTPPEIIAAPSDNLHLLPPGGEVHMSGPDGVIRTYRVDYKAFRMKQRDVDGGRWHSLFQTLPDDSGKKSSRKPPADDRRKPPPDDSRKPPPNS